MADKAMTAVPEVTACTAATSNVIMSRTSGQNVTTDDLRHIWTGLAGGRTAKSLARVFDVSERTVHAIRKAGRESNSSLEHASNSGKSVCTVTPCYATLLQGGWGYIIALNSARTS